MGQLVKVIGRCSAGKSADEGKEKASFKGIRQKESMVEVGRSTIGNGSRVLLESLLRLLLESFYIFSSSCL
jgi:hypothetical protein